MATDCSCARYSCIAALFFEQLLFSHDLSALSYQLLVAIAYDFQEELVRVSDGDSATNDKVDVVSLLPVGADSLPSHDFVELDVFKD